MKALLDANVLFSITLTDVLLSLAEAQLFEPYWTERILGEAERGLLGQPVARAIDTAAVGRRFQSMRDFFYGAMIDPADYEPLVAEMRNHDGDRHVLAAAVAVQADVVVTHHIRHFPPDALGGLPVGAVTTPDAFLCALHDTQEGDVHAVLHRMLANKRRPQMSVHDLTDHLRDSGAARFANRLSLLVGSRRRT
jgi:predicted nucleic acid-binding protein